MAISRAPGRPEAPAPRRWWALGARFGRRRVLITGLGVFLAGSVVGALAQDVEAVVAARAVMGVGAALVTPLALSVLSSLFAPDERTKPSASSRRAPRRACRSARSSAAGCSTTTGGARCS